LKGAIVMTVPVRQVNAWFKAPGDRYNDEALLRMANAVPTGQRQAGEPSDEQIRQFRAAVGLNNKRNEFLRSEGPALLIDSGRGDGGTLFVSSGGSRDKDAPPALPSFTMAVEHYGRIARMIEKGVKVKLEVEIKTRFHDD